MIGNSDGDPDGWIAVKVNSEGSIVMPYGPVHPYPDKPKDGPYRWAPFYIDAATPTPTIPAGMVVESEAERIGLAVADLVERHLTSPHMVWGVEKMPESWLTELRSILVASLESELAAAPKQAEQQGVERMLAALQEIADMPDNLVPTITVQGMRNVAGFALIGGHHAG